MNKNIMLTLIFSFLAIAVLAGPALADQPFDLLYPVGADGSTVLKDVFDWNETPYIYMKLPEYIPSNQIFEGNDTSHRWTRWDPPNPASDTQIFFSAGNGREYWHTLSNWNDVKEVGEWNIDTAEYKYLFGQGGTGTTSFTVTPEPLAMVLFLAGGAPIAVNLYRRKRKVM